LDQLKGVMKMEKEKALEAALLHIAKQFGKGSVMKLGQHVKTAIP